MRPEDGGSSGPTGVEVRHSDQRCKQAFRSALQAGDRLMGPVALRSLSGPYLARNGLAMGQYDHRARRENRKPAVPPRSRNIDDVPFPSPNYVPFSIPLSEAQPRVRSGGPRSPR